VSRFITLTAVALGQRLDTAQRLWMAVEHIAAVTRDDGSDLTTVVAGGETWHATETPAQILALIEGPFVSAREAELLDELQDQALLTLSERCREYRTAYYEAAQGKEEIAPLPGQLSIATCEYDGCQQPLVVDGDGVERCRVHGTQPKDVQAQEPS
jgi:hypothetical protein